MNVELSLAWTFGLGAAISLIGGFIAISEGYGYDAHWRPIGVGIVILTLPLLFFAVLFGSAA